MMQVTVSQTGAALTQEGSGIQIKLNPQLSRHLPVAWVQQLSTQKDCMISTRLLAALLVNGCEVVFEDHQQQPILINAVQFATGGKLRKNWMLLVANSTLTHSINCRLIAAKTRAQKRTIAKLCALKNITNMDTAAITTFRSQPWQLAENTNELLGIEGSVASRYFRALKHFLPPWCAFEQRNRRPAKDPFNATLNLTYMLSCDLLTRHITRAGFDPVFATFHTTDNNRPSLACDWLELFRASIDEWVITEVLPLLTPEHFSVCRENGACLLTQKGKNLYYPQWHGYKKQLDIRMERLVNQIKKRVMRYAESPLPDCL